MRRPPLTRKAISNLQHLWGFAEGEIDNYDNGSASQSAETKPAKEAIEWIRRASAWKTEQEEKRKEKTI
tara:strand:- start:4531 stop:4737 length:207 start_codon:yes stop_codon:yes gene_type:complete